MFQGIYTAVITPFNKNNEVDYTSLDRLIKKQLDAKVSGIVILGTTAESSCLLSSEKEEIIRFVVSKYKSLLQIIVGIGTNSTLSTIDNAKTAEKLGADALLVVNPYYNKPTQIGLYKHFEAVANSVKLPIMLYNIPSRTAAFLNLETTIEVAKIKNVLAIKDATNNLSYTMNLIQKKPKDFYVLAGDDSMLLPFLSIGGNGVVSVLGNIYPKELNSIYTLFRNNAYDQALKIHYNLLSQMEGLFIETNPIPVKTVLAIKQEIHEVFRLPLTKMMVNNKEKLKQVFNL